ncbi:hypothetical protein [Rheinheimera sp. UJ63]|uniref:hypothetical protein n=1 Tax=Rheinheimera sp. UJ63 TaxID=2910157 RepID=UPI001F30E944|nr:hypothetical protein [Rheinheimera sp. UJ63]MCF4010622.1 hypothetical protein [Rheinheimera sp. UJ63]
MIKVRASKVDKTLWPAFVSQQKQFESMPITFFKDASYPLPYVSGEDFASDMAVLSEYLTAEALSKIVTRYRTFKTRSKSNVTTITLNNKTIQRLKQFAYSNGYEFDTYDGLIELLIDPEDRKEAETLVEDPTSALTLDQSFNISRAKLKLRRHTWSTIVNYIDYAYRAGWLACKHLSGKNRTQNVLDEQAEHFMFEVQTGIKSKKN